MGCGGWLGGGELVGEWWLDWWLGWRPHGRLARRRKRWLEALGSKGEEVSGEGLGDDGGGLAASGGGGQ